MCYYLCMWVVKGAPDIFDQHFTVDRKPSLTPLECVCIKWHLRDWFLEAVKITVDLIFILINLSIYLELLFVVNDTCSNHQRELGAGL